MQRYQSCQEIRQHIWAIEKDRLLLTWTERGGPKVDHPPEGEGFGSLLARSSINGQLEGQLVYDWDPEGLTVRISATAERFSR